MNWSSPTVVKVGSKELKSTQEYPGHFGLAVSWLERTDGRFLNPVHVYKYSMPINIYIYLYHLYLYIKCIWVSIARYLHYI